MSPPQPSGQLSTRSLLSHISVLTCPGLQDRPTGCSSNQMHIWCSPDVWDSGLYGT